MRSKSNYYWLLAIIPLAFMAWYFTTAWRVKPTRLLPVYGPRYLSAEERDAHRVPDFSFINQDGQTFDQAGVKEKIYVAEFFFTTCQSICPIMNSNMVKLYQETKGENRLMFLSHTVDPETDSVPALKAYAERMGVHDARWQFLTGTKKTLYAMARKGYLLDDGTGQGDEDDFVHTQNFALVDWQRRIRGFYDGTDSMEMIRLKQDIAVLIQEFDLNEKSVN